MDKLELDERVGRLEQRVSRLTSLIVAFLVLGGGAAVFLMLMVRTSVRPSQATIIAPPIPTPMIKEVRSIEAMHAVRDTSEGSVGQMVNQLNDLWDLYQSSVITPSEFQNKKSQILSKPLRSSELKADLKQLAQLHEKTVLSPSEFQEVKTKILEAGK